MPTTSSKFQVEIYSSLHQGISAILQGKEVVLIKYKTKLNGMDDRKPFASTIASKLEQFLIEVPEIAEFYDICYGKNWGLRPCPIFKRQPHTIISKNIGINLGLSTNQLFEFAIDSTKNKRAQQLLFKLKPNHKLGPGNHLMFYNRNDGVICLEPTDTVVEYNALEYLLIFSPLLVIHKRQDMLSETVNICVDNEFNLSLLHDITIPNYSPILSVRELDLFAVRTNQQGLINHNGQLYSKFIAEEKNLPPGSIFLKEEDLKPSTILRYKVGTTRTQLAPTIDLDQPDLHAVDLVSMFEELNLSNQEKSQNQKPQQSPRHFAQDAFFGTLFHIWPSFLFRRNWFTALGNQREQGGWIGACRHWINQSNLALDTKRFLYDSWVPQDFHYLQGLQTSDGISASALHSKQLKFLLVNTLLLKTKILFEMTDFEMMDQSLLSEGFIPSSNWGDKLLKRRVVAKKDPTIILSTSDKEEKKKPNKPKKVTPKHHTSSGRSKKTTKTRSPSRSRSRSRPHESPQEFQILPEAESQKAKSWLIRINENIK